MAAIQAGGCGSWNGFGVTHPPRELERAGCPTRSTPRATSRTTISIASAHSARLPFAVDAEGGLLHRGRATGAPLDATLREDVDGRHLLGDARRVDEAERHQRDAEAEADVLGRLRERAEHDLGCGAVRATFAEVVLDEPHGVEAEGVGELDLVEHLVVRALLGLALPVRVRPRPTARGSISYSRSSFTRSS